MRESQKLNVLVFGSAGAREHALVRLALRSPVVGKVHCTGTNAGIERMLEVIDNDWLGEYGAVAQYCHDNQIDLVIVGPELPLANGIADVLREQGIAVFGPSALGARIETSKSWAVEFMQAYGIPTAETTVHTSLAAAKHGVEARDSWPVVVKYDGLMGGKGVTICHNLEEATAALEKLYHNESEAKVLLQEYLPDNPAMPRSEISVHVIVSGDGSYQILPTAQDYKPRFNGDTGPMTGGMGCFGPVPGIDMDRIEKEIVQATLVGLGDRGIDYRGVIYFGLKLCPDGPKVVEYNARFGDPEMVVLDRLVVSDLIPLMWAAAKGEDISNMAVDVYGGSAVAVVIVNRTYPDKGEPRLFPSHLDTDTTYHAATYSNGRSVVADGGRIAVVTAVAPTISSARHLVYCQIGQLPMPGLDCRMDIAASHE